MTSHLTPLAGEGRLWHQANSSEALTSGLQDRSNFIEVLLNCQQVTHDLFVERGAAGVTGFPQSVEEGRPAGVLQDMEFCERDADAWAQALALSDQLRQPGVAPPTITTVENSPVSLRLHERMFGSSTVVASNVRSLLSLVRP